MIITLITLTLLHLNSPVLTHITTYAENTVVTNASSSGATTSTHAMGDAKPLGESPYLQLKGEKGGLTLLRVGDELFIMLHRTDKPTNTLTVPLATYEER